MVLGRLRKPRHNLFGMAESFTASGLAGRLDQRGSLTYRMPRFRGSGWNASITGSGENNSENPIFSAQTGQIGVQFQKPLDAKHTKNIILRYGFQYTSLSNLLIPDLVPPQDQQYRLSNLGAAYTRDTRDNPLDAHHGIYQSFDITFNTSVLGSSADFARFVGQVSYYKNIGHNIIWANNVRLGLEQPFNGSFVPLSEQFFTGGGSTLRGFPLNGAGPQRELPACGDPLKSRDMHADHGSLRRQSVVPAQFGISHPAALRFSGADPQKSRPCDLLRWRQCFTQIGFHHIDFGGCTTNIVSSGSTSDRARLRSAIASPARSAPDCATRHPSARYASIIGHNLNGIPGIKSTELFITLGQAF